MKRRDEDGVSRYTGGLAMVILVVTAQIMYQASTVATSWWLGYWSAGAGYAKKINASEGLSVYAGLSGIAALLSVVAYGVASKLGQNAARSLHNQMLDGLLKAPMAFFEPDTSLEDWSTSSRRICIRLMRSYP